LSGSFNKWRHRMRLLKTLILVAGTAATLAFIPQAANAEKVCKEVCSAGVCRQDCIETEGRGDRREGVREERREDRREDRREERREERKPGVELRVPGVDLQLGR
jgi:hypothetical protein